MSRLVKILLLLFSLVLSPALRGQNDGFGATKQVKIACVGNSVTFGTGIENRETNCWPAQLQAMLGETYQVGNFGLPGATLLTKGHRPYVLSDEFKNALAFDADIVIISLGLNDTDPRNWPNYRDEFIGDYMKLVDSFRNIADKRVQIYICRLTPIFDRHPRFISGTRDWLDEIQQSIVRVAINSSCQLIDLHTPLYSRPDLFPDALHPNRQGATIIVQTVFSRLTGNFGGLDLPGYFGDHMVLQRDKIIPVVGSANINDTIQLTFAGKTYNVITGNDGKWAVNIPAMKAGGPFGMKIKNREQEISFEDIMIGDVWFCAGQSNMKFPLKASDGSEAKLKNSANGQIRLLNYKEIANTNDETWDSATLVQVNDLNYFSGKWAACSPTSAADFSAVAYYFGQSLQKELNVPIGLIQVAVGGAPAEAFIERRTLEFDPWLVNILKTWRSNDMIQQWCRDRAATNLKISQNPLQRHPYEPAYIYESKISSLTGFPIKGAIWYQGESNTHNLVLHEALFKSLVQSWRNSWGYEFPFYFVQLPSLNRPSWPAFRDSQRQLAQSVSNCGMAITIDCGDSLDVHPSQKKAVGDRLARLALFYTYKKTNLLPTGPLFDYAKTVGSKILIRFKYSDGLHTSNGAYPEGFEIAGGDQVFYPAQATIRTGNVIVWSKNVQNPVSVRYGWKPFFRSNLMNQAKIPASPFRSDVMITK